MGAPCHPARQQPSGRVLFRQRTPRLPQARRRVLSPARPEISRIQPDDQPLPPCGHPGFGGLSRLGSRRMHNDYSRWHNVQHGRHGHLWQSRFFSCPVEEDRVWGVLGYIELNPVRAHMVEHAWDWEWSSARRMLQESIRAACLKWTSGGSISTAPRGGTIWRKWRQIGH